MADSVMIKHASSGLVKSGKYGFSWTYLFFGWLVPLFRGPGQESGTIIKADKMGFWTF